MDFDAFISYSSKDKLAADAACAVLESSGVRCWIAPRDVTPGGEYGTAIVEAIERCRVMVLIFSSNANASAQIRREIERAVKKGVTIIPVRIEEVEPTQSMEYFLGAIHWLDALTPPLERHLQHLAETIKAMLQAKAGMPDDAKSAATPAARKSSAAPDVKGEKHAAPQQAAAKHDLRAEGYRGWVSKAVLAAVAVALAAAGLWAYRYVNQPKHPLGPPLDGWTLSGPQETILRYYPSPSAEDCRADCERAGEDCMGYTWVKPGGYQAGDGPMCYLNRWYNGITAHPCCITGNRGGTYPPGYTGPR
jgi:hypothetical protein